MLKNIFRLSVLTIFCAALLVLVTPVLTVNNLLYPVRIDSSYVSLQQTTYEKLLVKGKADSGHIFLYSPAQLQLNSENISIPVSENIMINGWIIIDSLRQASPLLLIVPDVNEGAIYYLPAMKEFSNRGINVCVIDMPGQGMSGGEKYDMTAEASKNLIVAVGEIKKRPYVNKVAIFGNRTGAAIAIKAFTDSASFADLLIIQNPIKDLNNYFKKQAIKEWGEFITPLMPALQRSYEQHTSISIDDYNYIVMLKELFVPHMLVAANFNSKKIVDETVSVYHASSYYRKRLYIDNDSFGKKPGFENSKQYFDKISAFINSSIPSKSKRSRFRKLAMH